MSEPQAYEIKVWRSQWEDYDESEMLQWDAEVVKFPDWDYLKIEFWKPQLIQGLPEIITFDALLLFTEMVDFVYNDAHWPIVSKRMLNALESMIDFSCQIIPLVLADIEVKYNKELKQDVLSDIKNYNYIALQLLEHLNIFDWDNSEYTLLHKKNPTVPPVAPNRLFELNKLVLKEPAEGYPPIFRITALPRHLFVSAQAKAQLEDHNIQGIRFVPLEDFELDEEDDFRFSEDQDFRVTLSRDEFDNINNPPDIRRVGIDLTYNYYMRLVEPTIERQIFFYGGTEPVEIDIYRMLTPGQKALCALTDLKTKVNEGGFPQLFYFSSPFIHRRISEALHLIGADEMAAVYDQELSDYQKGIGKGTGSPMLPCLTKNGPAMEQKLVEYIHAHREEFVLFTDDE
jgi:hypothetical protein